MVAERFALVVPSARNFPAFTCGTAVVAEANTERICPPSRSLIAGPPPLYGTWMRLAFAVSRNSSPARLPALPTPEVPYGRPPGRLFASFTYSAMVLAGRDGCTTSTFPDTVAMEIGAKSRNGLYGSFELRCGATASAAMVARRIV